MSASAERLHKRVRRVRAAVLVRRWEYRQRDHARGVWHRLRRLLADAEGAWTISGEEAAQLAQEGFAVEPVGAEVEPPKVILVLPRERASRLASARPLTVGLGPEFLAARHIALVPWPEAAVEDRE